MGHWCDTVLPIMMEMVAAVRPGATFSNARTQITIAANRVQGGRGIHNVMAKEVRRIKILSKNFENCFKKFWDNFWKIQEILRTFPKSISENFDN